MLFIRDGKLAFDIGWTGAVQGTTVINDGQDHTVGLRYSRSGANANQFCLLVDGQVDACGLSGVADRDGAGFLIGVSVGHDARTVASMAPIYKGKLWDFRVAQTAGDFEALVTKQQTDPAATDGSDGANMAGGSTTVTASSSSGSTTVTAVVATAATAADFVDDGTIATYETVTVTNADGTVTEETRVVGEEEEPTDEETAVEINQ